MASSLILQNASSLPATIKVDGLCYELVGHVNEVHDTGWPEVSTVFGDCTDCWADQDGIAYLWYEPGSTWYYGMGPGSGVVWYRTEGYSGTDVQLALAATWVPVGPFGVNPAPNASYDVGSNTVAVLTAGAEAVVGTYYQDGSVSGAPFYTMYSSSSSSSVYSSSSSSVVPSSSSSSVSSLSSSSVFSSSSSSSSSSLSSSS